MAALEEREDPLSEIIEVEKALKEGLSPGEAAKVGGPLLPQLMSFIDEASQKKGDSETIIAFTEGDRKGYLKCVYVRGGAFMFSHGRIRDKSLAALNITHVAIQKGGTTPNIIDRVSREGLSNEKIECVRIESILSKNWFDKFPGDWYTHNENSKVLFKNRGGRSRRKSKRRKSRKRK